MSSLNNMPASPTFFQTYLLPSIPFRRRSSINSVASSFSARQSTFGSPPLADSPTSPITPLASPSDASFFRSTYIHRRTNSNSNSNPLSYDFHTSPSPVPTWARKDSHDSEDLAGSYAYSPRRPSYLSGHTSHISCGKCQADLALTSQIISKGFTGRHGRAYLVAASSSSLACASPDGQTPASLPNTQTHKPVQRQLVTGLHTVADISCAVCGLILGWKYVAAEEETQRYKVGKFILETRRCSVGACWEHDEDDETGFGAQDVGDGAGFFGGAGMEGIDGGGKRGSVGRKQGEAHDSDASEDGGDGKDIVFDSQDEDECEDLFSGIWSPALAKQRRARNRSLAR